MIFFHNDIVEIYEEISDNEKCGVDQYNKPRKCIQLRCMVNGDLQPVSSDESRHTFGTKTSNSHKLYLNPDVEVKNTDILKINGYKGVFKIVGEPMLYNKFIHHQLVSLRHMPHERRVRI